MGSYPTIGVVGLSPPLLLIPGVGIDDFDYISDDEEEEEGAFVVLPTVTNVFVLVLPCRDTHHY